jgi:hypothetical protein
MYKLSKLLLKLSELFQKHGFKSRSELLYSFYKESLSYHKGHFDLYFIREIMNLYGGMGSFFDLVLTKNGVPLKEENIELASYENLLYEECVNLRAKNHTKNPDEKEPNEDYEHNHENK